MPDKRLRTTVATPDGPITEERVYEKEQQFLNVPYRVIDNDHEGITMGFRQMMCEVGPGSVATGAGYGNDNILLEWNDKLVVIRGSELLKAWVSTFSPEDAARFPKGVK